MFDPIKGPTDQYSGPAVGLTTEKGDSWHTAVAKINAGFQHIISLIEGGVPAVETAAEGSWQKVAHDLAEAMSLLQIKHDALESKVRSLGGQQVFTGATGGSVGTVGAVASSGGNVSQGGVGGVLGGASGLGKAYAEGTQAPPVEAKPLAPVEADQPPATFGTSASLLANLGKEPDAPTPEPQPGVVTTSGPVSATSHD